ncbi:sulfate ABC transporter periplasmic sulfate-binding protein [gamma proteobacterium BDW918]|uniref:Sulfate-binding protein n=1 Tax=Zhongshania aliphaticivorans TaxID=1470434 RepID=A0A127M535_9GAMM|nr:sulfate ABC transporter substrate-binding protein [Zhongshania aliphaticivorans]AMO68339.1 ABC transporter permease [Zhongshania aliphaticivorans]EIF44235.1 sulfate ABC transporter periplasmic sulfate-binding protein [gamma proteobacterium BDW918]
MKTSRRTRLFAPFAGSLVLASLLSSTTVDAKDYSLLNVSYDPTRELYQEFNAEFSRYWKEKTGDQIAIKQSHGGSGKQARSVIDGLSADVVTLALAYDIDVISKQTGKLAENWQSQLASNSAPYTSTIVLLVRKNNPKKIHDWPDLIKPGISVVTPNPKTSGGARWNYLAAYAFAKHAYGSDAAAEEFISTLFKRVSVLDTGARAATTTFAQRGIGDVLITWENEAYLALNEFGADKFEIVLPSISIKAEPPVAVVAANAQKHGVATIAQGYLEYLYSPQGQTIIAKHYFRPAKPELISSAEIPHLPELKLVNINQEFGGWEQVQAKHFKDGGVFDQLYRPRR